MRVLLHTSKTGDDIKTQLCDVNELWKQYNVVIFTPTIAAGVDFSEAHFDRMYFYACTMSASAMTALQMMFRVRHLTDPEVDFCIAKNMTTKIGDEQRETNGAPNTTNK